jgi:hypothetical protein
MMEAYAPRLENQLPLLFLVAPNSYLDKYPAARKNLQENAQKLITGFDIYQTIGQVSVLYRMDIDSVDFGKYFESEAETS